MARTAEECDTLMAAAAHSGGILSIGHEPRLSAQRGRIEAMIDEGEIGDALTLRARVEDRQTTAAPA